MGQPVAFARKCPNILHKWKKIENDVCQYCHITETAKHMLYECARIHDIWLDVMNILGCDITWKTIVCGFPKYQPSVKISSINYIIGIICYSIFKLNMYCKFNGVNYKFANVKNRITGDLQWQAKILSVIHPNIYNSCTFRNFVNKYA